MNAQGANCESGDQRRSWSRRFEAAINADFRFWVGSAKARWRTPLICLLAPGSLLVLTEWLAVSPWGFKGLVGMYTVITMPVTVALGGILVAPWFLFFKKRRRAALFGLTCSVACLIGFFVAALPSAHIRRSAFAALTERSTPLIAAVTKYEREQGKPPDSLDALVPEYLPCVPSTRMGAYPKYEYVSGDKAKRFEGNPWAIYVFTPSGGINFDQFLYFPLQNYPERGFGGWLERIGDWAYVHE